MELKIAILIVVTGISNAIATPTYSQVAKVSLDMENSTLERVMDEIERQSEFYFIFNQKHIDVNRVVDVQANKKFITDILPELFNGTNVKYAVLDKKILLTADYLEKEIVVLNNYDLQQNQIAGTVKDENGNPLPGVSVVVKGTTLGTLTDFSGKYAIPSVAADASLIFSFIGMASQEITVSGRTQIDIILREEAVGLDEVIVIGYGTTKKADLTGSVIRMKGEDFRTQSTVQVSDMLAGTVAGFYANQSTSAAGGSSMEVRGPTSLSAGTDPLIVLDGVIFNGSMLDINTNDIESIDILKDASSAAVFGSKAASGVVIITTTRGRTGKPTIGFSTKIGISESAHDYKPLGPEEFLKFRGDYFRTQSYYTLPRYYYTHPNRLPDDISVDDWRNYSSNPNSDNVVEYLNRHKLQATEIEQYLAGKPTDWYDMVMVNGLKQDYDLNISGGTDNVTYYWSMGYVDNEGIILGDKFSAIRSRINVDFKVNDWLNAGINAQYSDRDESVTPASLTRTYRISPWGRPYNEDGSLNLSPQELFTAEHPLMEYYGTDRFRKVNSFFSSIYLELKLPLDIKYRLSFQPRNSWTKDYVFYGEDHTTGFASHIDGYGTRDESSVAEWMIDNLLKWNKTIGIHNIDLTLLYNTEQLKSWDTNLNNETFSPNLQLGYHALQFGNKPNLSNEDMQSTGDALMGRVNYSLLGKYLLTLSVRRDGYSAFGQENPRAFFPAAAFAWQVSEEDFFNISFINRMKLRLSWGTNGNRDIGIYSALANLGSNLWYDGSKVMVGVYNSTLANANLQWERTEAINAGFDIGLFQNQIDLSIDYYNMTTTNLLMNRRLPDLTGFRSIMSNLGELGNQGFEMTINSVNISKPAFTWKSNFVLSLNRNKIIRLFGDLGTYTLLGEERYGDLPDYTNQWFPGKAVDIIWDYRIQGIWQEDESAEASEYGLRPGDFKVADVDGDGDYININDKEFIGYEKPRYRLGLRNDFNFLKIFTASLFIRADLGHLGDFSPPVFQASSEFDRFSMSRKPVPYWMPENPINDYPRLDCSTNMGAYGGGINVHKPLSFIRIQDFSLSYNLPQPMAQKLSLRNINIFTSIRNLYSFDKWPGFDPESGLNPMPRTYTVGINMSL